VLELTMTVPNKLGLHIRAVSKFVNIAGRFQSAININIGSKTVNGKSLMSLLTLGAKQGDIVKLIVDGLDEQDAMNALTQLINNRFDEPE
jgi:phosphocarrier protein HPr